MALLTARQLNRATLHRQHLLARARVPAVEAVRRVVAIQAQEPASPFVALWNRVAAFDADDLHRAFAAGEIVKATLLRITLHAVTLHDHGPFRAAMESNLRAARLNDDRFKATGLTPADADRLIPDLVAFARSPRTKEEIEAHLTEAVGSTPPPGLWWALRTVAPLVHAPTGGPWSFGLRPSFLAAPAPVADLDPEASLRRLAWRYLEAFGPATAADFAQFAMQKRTVARATFEALAERLHRHDGPEGLAVFDLPEGAVPDGDTPAPPRLLPMWDSTLLAYDDRRRLIPEDLRSLVIRRNGDVLPTLLIDGFVAGVWRPVEDGIEVAPLRPLDDDTWHDVTTEARALLEFLRSRDPTIYRRYAGWWSKLPVPHPRVLVR